MPLHARLQAVLPPDTGATWELLAPAIPSALYLAGGTGLAVHLHHRKSRDLDFFYHHNAVDLDALEATLGNLGAFAVTDRSPGTLNGVFSATRLQFLHADQVAPQHLLEAPVTVEGLRIASVSDIFAMKLAVIAKRGELRDYFDLMTIETKTQRGVEEGLSLVLARYGLDPTAGAITAIVNALGYLDDVDNDPSLPANKNDIAAYWHRRQPQIVRSLGRQLPVPASPLSPEH
jgi:hypothetical protein